MDRTTQQLSIRKKKKKRLSEDIKVLDKGG